MQIREHWEGTAAECRKMFCKKQKADSRRGIVLKLSSFLTI